MPTVLCSTADEWIAKVTDHGSKTGHSKFLWADEVGFEYALHCGACDTRFAIRSYDLRTEYFATSGVAKARLLYDALKTQDGKRRLLEALDSAIRAARLLEALDSAIRAARARTSTTAWERILADESF